MKKVGIVSCDKWIGKIEEDINLKMALEDLGIECEIISWQQPLNGDYDALILRSVWGYQNNYNEFKDWLFSIKEKNISLFNNPDLVMDNIRKDIQFKILEKNSIACIKTKFLNKYELYDKNKLGNIPYVIKPTISGSGENTYLVSIKSDLPNTIKEEDVFKIYNPILKNNYDCNIMIQPFIKEVNNGEYSCIFMDGELTHTMLRYPNIFHDKKKPHLISSVPHSIINLAKKVEKIPEFKDYLYMRVDMVLIDEVPHIMEVELAEPDLLTRYIEDEKIKSSVMKIFAKKIERKIIK